jgi:pimeloyl-ACP methyl ester carboxylesterase
MKQFHIGSLAFALGASASLALAIPLPASAQSKAAEPARLYVDSKFVATDRISVEIVGTGPDVILIPGLASSRETWRRTTDRLRAKFRLHLVQINGFAGTPAQANASGPMFDAVAAAISAYLRTFKLPVPVAGHSLGGTLGLAIAERHPGLISKLMLVDTLPFFGVVMGGPGATPDTIRPMATAMKAGMARAMPEARAHQMAASMITAPADVSRLVGWMQASDPAVVATAMADDMLTDLRPGLATVGIPVTILYETPLGDAVKTGYAALPEKSLIEVPGAKHFIMYDQPALFDDALDTFLRTQLSIRHGKREAPLPQFLHRAVALEMEPHIACSLLSPIIR